MTTKTGALDHPAAYHFRVNGVCVEADSLSKDVLRMNGDKHPALFNMIRGATGKRTWCEKCEGELL